ncbi:MAG TPA: DNA repair protein RecO [Candidatus Acidoferrales bacterium]|jgi:DNA repair protein RecO (recombination protein O)|nr:DNA repair protein RecO [Candidatus Acidoferrales bacterium]
MIESGAGIILRTLPLTETSLIVHWLSPTFGRIATAAKGARRPKSPFAGKLDLYYEADISFSRSRSSDLHSLREVNLRQMNAALRLDLEKLREAAYAASFIVRATEPETPLPEIFELFRRFLESLCVHESSPQLVLAFELKMLVELGLEPDWKESKLEPGTRKIVEAMSQRDFASIFGVKPADKQINELRQFLHGFIIFHLGKIPAGRAGALG